MDFVDLYEKLEALERREMMKIFHIQQDKLEMDGGEYHPQEQMEEVGLEPTQGEMEEANLSEELIEQQFSQEDTAELESAIGWQTKATRYGDNIRGIRLIYPLIKEVQQRRLHKKSQPLEQLDIE
jgi:hypothetical protein